MQVHKDRFHRGYLPLGTTKYPGKAADLKDSFDIGIDLPLTHPDVKAGLPLHGPNQWPVADWFKEPAERYFSAVKSFGFKLLLAFAKSLDLEDDFFLRHMIIRQYLCVCYIIHRNRRQKRGDRSVLLLTQITE